MTLSLRSVRTKFMLLVTGVALLVVAVVSVAYDLWPARAAARAGRPAWPLHREQPRLQQQVRRASPRTSRCSRSSWRAPCPRRRRAESDVVGAMIRDAKGAILAQNGKPITDLPRSCRPRASRSATR